MAFLHEAAMNVWQTSARRGMRLRRAVSGALPVVVIFAVLDVGCASRNRDSSLVRNDIALVVGGNFTPDGIGPEIHQQVLGRIQREPSTYVTVFESEYARDDVQMITRLSQYLPAFLEMVHSQDPEHVETVARRLIRQYDELLFIYDAATDKQALFNLMTEETKQQILHLDTRRRQLRQLLDETGSESTGNPESNDSSG